MLVRVERAEERLKETLAAVIVRNKRQAHNKRRIAAPGGVIYAHNARAMVRAREEKEAAVLAARETRK